MQMSHSCGTFKIRGVRDRPTPPSPQAALKDHWTRRGPLSWSYRSPTGGTKSTLSLMSVLSPSWTFLLIGSSHLALNCCSPPGVRKALPEPWAGFSVKTAAVVLVVAAAKEYNPGSKGLTAPAGVLLILIRHRRRVSYQIGLLHSSKFLTLFLPLCRPRSESSDPSSPAPTPTKLWSHPWPAYWTFSASARCLPVCTRHPNATTSRRTRWRRRRSQTKVLLHFSHTPICRGAPSSRSYTGWEEREKVGKEKNLKKKLTLHMLCSPSAGTDLHFLWRHSPGRRPCHAPRHLALNLSSRCSAPWDLHSPSAVKCILPSIKPAHALICSKNQNF